MVVDIGFRLTSGFLSLLKICHSVETEGTHWVEHTIQGASLGMINHKRASDFKEGSVFFGNISADQTYNSRRQKKHLNQRFGVSRARELLVQVSLIVAIWLPTQISLFEIGKRPLFIMQMWLHSGVR